VAGGDDLKAGLPKALIADALPDKKKPNVVGSAIPLNATAKITFSFCPQNCNIHCENEIYSLRSIVLVLLRVPTPGVPTVGRWIASLQASSIGHRLSRHPHFPQNYGKKNHRNFLQKKINFAFPAFSLKAIKPPRT